MDKLTEAELEWLPTERMRINYVRAWDYIEKTAASRWKVTTLSAEKEDFVELCNALAHAHTPQPSCGHPRGCVVSVPYMVDVGEASSCGWCADDKTIGHLRKALWVTKRDRDALREKLDLAQAENRRLFESRSKVVASLTVENDALREKLADATIQLEATDIQMDAKQMRLELAQDSLAREREKLAAAKAELAEAYRQLSHEAVG